MSGVGGIGLALVYVAGEGRTRALNFSGHAPQAARPEIYDRFNIETGPLAPLVPGNVSGWLTMREEYGSLSLQRVFRDAVRYAEEGIALTPWGARLIEENLERIDRFESSNPDMLLEWVLRDQAVDKDECLRRVRDAGIVQHEMYRLGYRNANCLGCVKATSAAYWMRVRTDFPGVFARRVAQSRELGVRLARWQGERVFLDELMKTGDVQEGIASFFEKRRPQWKNR